MPRAARSLSGLFAVVITAKAQTTAAWDPATNPSGTGTARINAGTLNLLRWHPADSIKRTSVLDISGRQVVITGNRVSSVDALIAAGKIMGYGGIGTVEKLFDQGATTTTLTAMIAKPGTPGLLGLGLLVAAGGRAGSRAA